MLCNLGDLVDRTQDPDKLALIDCLDWERPAHYSHRDIDRLACAVASALARRGFETGQRVGILSANRAEFLAAYFGIMRAGLVAVPINHKFPRATIEFVLQDSDVRLLHAVAREHRVDPGLDEDYGVFELGRPRVCADDEIDVLLPLDGPLLDRKVEALLLQESQTGGLVAAVGLPRFRAWVATEALAAPLARDPR